MTILTCYGKGKRAAKKFVKHDDGSIEKIGYNAGMFFEHEERPVNSIYDVANVINDIGDNQRKSIIRAQIKDDMPKLVRRKIHAPEAAFDPVARPYVMFDFDNLKCPEHFDASQNPQQIVKWVIETLPNSFQNVTCFYKFSSSQNIPDEKGKIPRGAISLHLWFWCDRSVLGEEWKNYFKTVPAPIDQALFSPVQLHFTANPVFENMDDPLQQRSGMIVGDSEFIVVPKIPEVKIHAAPGRTEDEPEVSMDARQKALDILSPYYQKGSRNEFCGAIAATLYRKGWKAENAAHLVLELAEASDDEEAQSRYDNAIHICNAVDMGRRAKGIPTLKNKFEINELSEVLDLLGIGKPDIDKLISGLNNQSSLSDIEKVVKALCPMSIAEQEFYLDKIKNRTKNNITALRKMLKEVAYDEPHCGAQDYADILTEKLLSYEYKEGQNLLNSPDRSYWFYNDHFWERIPIQHIKNLLLPHARDLIAEIEVGTISSFNNEVLNILEGRVYRNDDPLRKFSADPKPIINCRNGELWFDKNGKATLKPHRADSYLRCCLDVNYDPDATSPMFDKAALEIFGKSNDPQGMFRHFMELAGYICQYEREHAIIVLLHGGGSNGKTSLVKVIRKMLGKNSVMSDRISSIEDSVFKIGDLDGKLMLLDDDVDGGTCLPDGFLKKISEEKAMTGQHKRQHPFEFVCRTVPVMLANDYPVTSDLTMGLRRRLMVIPFKQTFTGKNMKTGLFDEIWDKEASGILNHAVTGFQRLKQRGHFEQPDDCLNAKAEWIARANILTTFIQEECELNESYRMHLGNFYEAFRDYCREVGVRNQQTRRGVENRLEALGYRIGPLDGKKAVWGLRVTPPDFESRKAITVPNL